MDEVEEQERHEWERPGTFPVAAGVYRIPLPLPGDGLAAVNVYALPTPDGVTLIDAGWALAGAREHLEAGLARLDLDLGAVREILVTHLHRDHFEQAVVLQRELGTRVALAEAERPSLTYLLDEEADHDLSPIVTRLRAAGAGALADRIHAHRAQAAAAAEEMPQWGLPDHWLTDGERLTVGSRELTVLHTPGHTRGHVVFVDLAGGLLFAGDHVLPHITPSIGFEAVPVDSPLSDYLASLAAVRGLADLRLLPAHGPVQPTTHDRIDALLVHHEHRLRRTAEAVTAGHLTGLEVATALPWTRRERRFAELDPFNQMLAVNETAAHLDVLVRREELAVSVIEGVRVYAA